MDEIEIPQYFICPISLQMMKDPVTAISGITYDRESIENWLSTAKNSTCPVTKSPLPADSLLIPNHTLRRLIQSWCSGNGVDRIPTPKSPLHKSHFLSLIQNLHLPHLQDKALNKLDRLAGESSRNKTFMAEAGAVEAMVSLIIKLSGEGKTSGLEAALRILQLIWTPTRENKQLLKENTDFVESIVWVLRSDIENQVSVKTNAVLVLQNAMEVVSSGILETLKRDFFTEMVRVLRVKLSHQAIQAALKILIEVCPWGRNRSRIVQAGAVMELIELELDKPTKSSTELIFCLLAHLSSCAAGRAQILEHGGGVALVAKRILRVSPATDDRAIHILSLISKFSASQEVLREMLRVGAVSKLCMVLQANCGKSLKDKSREILRLHSGVWNNSPCISVYLLTRDPR